MDDVTGVNPYKEEYVDEWAVGYIRKINNCPSRTHYAGAVGSQSPNVIYDRKINYLPQQDSLMQGLSALTCQTSFILFPLSKRKSLVKGLMEKVLYLVQGLCDYKES